MQARLPRQHRRLACSWVGSSMRGTVMGLPTTMYMGTWQAGSGEVHAWAHAVRAPAAQCSGAKREGHRGCGVAAQAVPAAPLAAWVSPAWA